MTPGIYPNLSNEEYHAHKESISRSALMDFKESPRRYWANHLNPDRPKKYATPAMIFGSMFHSFILEPEVFKREYVVSPVPVLLKDVGREKYEAYKAEMEALKTGKSIVIHPEDYSNLCDMKDALQKDNRAMNLIDGGTYEQSYFWTDPATGLLLKARPDILHREMIIDVKTCADASPKGFQRAMVAGGYHYQGAMIQDGVKELTGRFIENVINIAIETKYPYSIGIYIIDPEALEYARKDYKELLVALKDAKSDNYWMDYEIQTIGLPSWAIN